MVRRNFKCPDRLLRQSIIFPPIILTFESSKASSATTCHRRRRSHRPPRRMTIPTHAAFIIVVVVVRHHMMSGRLSNASQSPPRSWLYNRMLMRASFPLRYYSSSRTLPSAHSRGRAVPSVPPSSAGTKRLPPRGPMPNTVLQCARRDARVVLHTEFARPAVKLAHCATLSSLQQPARARAVRPRCTLHDNDRNAQRPDAMVIMAEEAFALSGGGL